MICEDEGFTRMHLNTILTKAGLTVVGEAADGKEAVEVVLRVRPDIVLMDVRMPEMSGIDAARTILESFQTHIIMLTGYADDVTYLRSFAFGAAGFIAKPFTSDNLIPRLREAMATAAARSE